MNTGILLGIIIGILFIKNVYPILDSICELTCIKIEELKNRIIIRIRETGTELDEDTHRPIGFGVGGDDNAEKV